MAIHQHICFGADCDTPDCKPFRDHEYTPHFDSADEAITRLVADWDWSHINGVLRCRDCTDTYRCEQEGHLWRRSLTDHGAQAAQEYCERCSETQYLAIT